jgi:hypothetical protein
MLRLLYEKSLYRVRDITRAQRGSGVIALVRVV